ncbi:MAG: RnfABCDGE type electron transport complex subunit B [Clostridia bacterium]|nr:RnfABCDGE type electron transport complex subunit B [Clostridia bacterium]
MTDILNPALAIGGIGIVLGILLAIASKLFAVEVDERIPLILEKLPGANCGGCGFTGCEAYAQAIVRGASVTLCGAGGQKAADEIGAIMGVKAGEVVQKKAVVLCAGTLQKAADKYDYIGKRDCLSAFKAHGGGPKSCDYGCLGYGTCVSACTRNAIKIVDGIAVVDVQKCGGCGSCAASCPKGIITLVEAKNKYVVKCTSCDKGAAMKSICSAGCIGCGLCIKACQYGAVSIENSHAVIDYTKCVGCGECAKKCPRGIICTIDGGGTECTEEKSASSEVVL